MKNMRNTILTKRRLFETFVPEVQNADLEGIRDIPLLTRGSVVDFLISEFSFVALSGLASVMDPNSLGLAWARGVAARACSLR